MDEYDRAEEKRLKKILTEGAEYLGLLQYIADEISKENIGLDYIDKIINQKLEKWDTQLKRKEKE